MVNKRIATLGLSLLFLLLSGCSVVPGAGKGEIDFREIFESRRGNQLEIERTVELDADLDPDDEWLVLYRFDPTERADWRNTPVHGIVYDAVPCDPPLLHNWRLPFPDNDYVGEGDEVRARMADWLNSGDSREATNELIIEGPGPVNTLSIYRFHDYVQNPCLPPDDSKQGFSLLGFFRSNGPISWDETTRTITTFQRTSFERSQLAIRSTYLPLGSTSGAESFIAPNGRTKNPDEQTIDFLYGQPKSPLDSPYPEKAVAAFYLSLGQDNERAASFLTPELAAQFPARTWGLDFTPDQVQRALIYSISYTPDREAELARRDREITIVVSAVDQQNRRQPPRRVTWRLIGIPIREGEPDCEWRLAEIKSVVVTEGLGMLDTNLFDRESLAVVP